MPGVPLRPAASPAAAARESSGAPARIAAAVAETMAIYTDYESRPIERSCIGRADCCHFQRTGRTPYLTLGESLVAAKAWRAAGRSNVPAPGADGACPFLSLGRCLIHAGRPFGCRTHFCPAAGGPVPRAEAREWIQRLEGVDAALGGEGGVNLPVAVQRAMEMLADGGKNRRKGKSGGRR